MKKEVGLICCLIWAVGCFATQQPQSALRFDHTNYDFGMIAETAGVVSHVFRFTNTQAKPVVIEEVITTCGCTDVQYDRRPILSGQSSSITVRFDPKGRTNSFHKSIRIVTNQRQSVISLFISGKIRLVEEPNEHLYEIADDVYVDQFTLSFGTLPHQSEWLPQTVILYNKSNRPIRIASMLEQNNGTLHICHPSQLAAGGKAKLEVKVMDVSDYFGSIFNRIRLSIDGISTPPILIYGYLVDSRNGIRIADAPQCEVLNGYYNFGTVERNAHCTHLFTLRNKGKNPLIIRKVESDGPLLTDFVKQRTLNTGESISIRITVDTSHAATLDSSVRIISNDLKKPVILLKVEGKIFSSFGAS